MLWFLYMLYNGTDEQQAEWMHWFQIEGELNTNFDWEIQVCFSEIQVTIFPLCTSLLFKISKNKNKHSSPPPK